MKVKIEAEPRKVQRKRSSRKSALPRRREPNPGCYSVRESGPTYHTMAHTPPAARLAVYVPVGCVPFGEPVSAPADAARLLNEICGVSGLGVEGMFCAYLNPRNRPLDVACVAVGGVDYCYASHAAIFHGAICCGSCDFILFHNHPSGEVIPSADDIQLTNSIIAAGKIMRMRLLDHIIIGKDKFLSLRDSGQIGPWEREKNRRLRR